MKTKTTFLKKIVPLYCLTMLFSFSSRLYSQIIYTNIPDATPNASYTLDLNNDSIEDFNIHFEAIDKVICTPIHNNAYSGEFTGGEFFPWALTQSTAICSTLTWYGAGNPGTMAWGASIGYWGGATDKYLALKLIVGTNVYYGWARLDFLATSSSFVIKDYAYESTPNACIVTGKTSLGSVENIPRKLLFIFPNPLISAATVHIQPAGNYKNMVLTICNSHGQMVKQVNNISAQTISLSRGNLPGGLYYIRLTENSKVIAVDKFVIAD